MSPRCGLHVLWMVYTLTAYFDQHGSVGRQLTATLAHHHSTICYEYAVILYVIYVQWMLEINSILFYSIYIYWGKAMDHRAPGRRFTPGLCLGRLSITHIFVHMTGWAQFGGINTI